METLILNVINVTAIIGRIMAESCFRNRQQGLLIEKYYVQDLEKYSSIISIIIHEIDVCDTQAVKMF